MLADFRCHDYTLILIGQIRTNEKDGLAPFDAVVEATVQRSRPVILTALAAMLAFIPLTHSVFWGTLAYTLIGGTFGGTVLTCPSSNALRQFAAFAKGGSGSSGLEVKRLSLGAAIVVSMVSRLILSRWSRMVWPRPK